MSIATKRGDAGETGLAGGIRVSKASLRVEAYGTIDELNSWLGFSRAICTDQEIKTFPKDLQRELFSVGSALATPPESRKKQPPVTTEMVDRLTAEIHRIEAIEGVLADWSIPGEHPVSAALDVARTICRRAERCAVRLNESGVDIKPEILAYLNRLSDLIWILGHLVEKQEGVRSPILMSRRSRTLSARAFWPSRTSWRQKASPLPRPGRDPIIVFSATSPAYADPQIAPLKAIRTAQVVELPSRQLLTVSHHLADAVLALSSTVAALDRSEH